MAAAKALAVFEIVELILRFHSRNAKRLRKPAKQLFALQRVNKLFKGVISRSSVLQQRMFLQKAPAGSSKQRYWSPAIWMVRSLARHGHNVYINGHDEILSFDVACRKAMMMAAPTASAWLRSDASWRTMEVYSTEACALGEIAAVVERHFGDEDELWQVYKKYRTLGGLADWLIRKSDCPEHRKEYHPLKWAEMESEEERSGETENQQSDGENKTDE